MGIERKSKCQDLVSVKCEKKKKNAPWGSELHFGETFDVFCVCVYINKNNNFCIIIIIIYNK